MAHGPRGNGTARALSALIRNFAPHSHQTQRPPCKATIAPSNCDRAITATRSIDRSVDRSIDPPSCEVESMGTTSQDSKSRQTVNGRDAPPAEAPGRDKQNLNNGRGEHSWEGRRTTTINQQSTKWRLATLRQERSRFMCSEYRVK